MLCKLLIDNYILIDRLEADFSSGLTVITGETGAGKSIFLGALSLLMGARNESGVLLDEGRKCVLEAEFVVDPKVKPLFEELELDWAEETLVRREILPNGKSRAFINDTPASLQQLKEIASQLIDFNSQHHSLLLLDPAFQMQCVDALAGTTSELEDYLKLSKSLRSEQKSLEEKRLRWEKLQQESDYLQFLYSELEQAQMVETDELEKAEEEYTLLSDSEEILRRLALASETLGESESSANQQLGFALTQLSAVRSRMVDVENLHERLRSVQIELNDIAREIQFCQEKVQPNPERQYQLEQRIQVLNRLLLKHHVKSLADLIQIREKISGSLQDTSSLEEEVQQAEKRLSELQTLQNQKAEALHDRRVKCLPEFEKQLKPLLTEVGLKEAAFKVELLKLEHPTSSLFAGSQIRFLFSANEGREPSNLKNSASGGELSRLMLCIKKHLAEKLAMPTLLFDEIDTGISGETARKVGRLMKQIGGKQQVLTITHLPQIASLGDAHWYVQKEKTDRGTRTVIRKLEQEERIRAIASMLSGEDPGQSALENARELLQGR